MKIKPEIVQAQWEDYAEAAVLMQEVHDIHSQGRPDIYRNAEHVFTEEEFKKSIVNPQELFLTAKVEGYVAGICQVNFAPIRGSEVTVFRERAYVETLCVKKEYRGMGIGTALLKRAEEEAARKNIRRMELMVWNFNEDVAEYYKNYGMKCQRMVLEKEIK